MVDIQVDPNATSLFGPRLGANWYKVWTGLDIVYDFYMPDNFTIAYRKSIDGGLTYGAEVTILTDALEQIMKAVLYWDRTTPGDTGTLVHFHAISRDTGAGATSGHRYLNLDTSTDTLSTPVDVGRGGVEAVAQWGASCTSLAKARSGRLYLQEHVDTGAVDNGLFTSDDGGVTWVERTSGIDLAAEVDNFLLMPASTLDPNDMLMIYGDRADGALRTKFYDASLDTWTATADWAVGIAWETAYFQFACGIRHSNGNLFVPWWNIMGAVSDDLNMAEVAGPLFADVTIRAVLELNTIDGFGEVTCTVATESDDIYVAFLRRLTGGAGVDWESRVNVHHHVSTNGAVSWGPRVQFSEDAPDDLRWVRSQPSIGPNGSGGRWMPSWQNFDLADVMTNGDNSIQLLPDPPDPSPPPPIVGAGEAFGGGPPPGSIIYITPDNIVYPLVTPHRVGRFVMSFSGFGAAPAQFITQRGPFQDGETIRDFNLTPRTVQVLERQQFKDRPAWWDGRAALLNDLRPNRQLTATAVVPGVLRMVTEGGDVRDLNVFITDGPRFEPRNVDEWDEWAFTEVLRFTAYDPLFFDPAEVSLLLAFGLDAHLVFPITFPIQFGSGLIDVSTNLDYVGTWASLPTIVIVGPIDNPIIDNVTTGETLNLLTNIGPERTVTINLAFGAKTIVDDLGNNLLGSLSTDSDLGTWHIAPTPEADQVTGQPRPTARNVIRLRGSNPTGRTSATVRYFTRYYGI